jgi:hypothetical protein
MTEQANNNEEAWKYAQKAMSRYGGVHPSALAY